MPSLSSVTRCFHLLLFLLSTVATAKPFAVSSSRTKRDETGSYDYPDYAGKEYTVTDGEDAEPIVSASDDDEASSDTCEPLMPYLYNHKFGCCNGIIYVDQEQNTYCQDKVIYNAATGQPVDISYFNGRTISVTELIGKLFLPTSNEVESSGIEKRAASMTPRSLSGIIASMLQTPSTSRLFQSLVLNTLEPLMNQLHKPFDGIGSISSLAGMGRPSQSEGITEAIDEEQEQQQQQQQQQQQPQPQQPQYPRPIQEPDDRATILAMHQPQQQPAPQQQPLQLPGIVWGKPTENGFEEYVEPQPPLPPTQPPPPQQQAAPIFQPWQPPRQQQQQRPVVDIHPRPYNPDQKFRLTPIPYQQLKIQPSFQRFQIVPTTYQMQGYRLEPAYQQPQPQAQPQPQPTAPAPPPQPQPQPQVLQPTQQPQYQYYPAQAVYQTVPPLSYQYQIQYQPAVPGTKIIIQPTSPPAQKQEQNNNADLSTSYSNNDNNNHHQQSDGDSSKSQHYIYVRAAGPFQVLVNNAPRPVVLQQTPYGYQAVRIRPHVGITFYGR